MSLYITFHEFQIKMSDSNDSDGDFVLSKKSKKKSSMIYSDPEVWGSDQEDSPVKNKRKGKSKKFIKSDSEKSDSDFESETEESESDEDFSSPKKNRKSSKKRRSDSGFKDKSVDFAIKKGVIDRNGKLRSRVV